jgi:hypothetical protein
MMGRRQKLHGGDEWEAVSRHWRRYVHRKPGQIKWVKRKMNKGLRRELNLGIRSSTETDRNG